MALSLSSARLILPLWGLALSSSAGATEPHISQEEAIYRFAQDRDPVLGRAPAEGLAQALDQGRAVLDPSLRSTGEVQYVVCPGSFNPVHSGHRVRLYPPVWLFACLSFCPSVHRPDRRCAEFVLFV